MRELREIEVMFCWENRKSDKTLVRTVRTKHKLFGRKREEPRTKGNC